MVECPVDTIHRPIGDGVGGCWRGGGGPSDVNATDMPGQVRHPSVELADVFSNNDHGFNNENHGICNFII